MKRNILIVLSLILLIHSSAFLQNKNNVKLILELDFGNPIEVKKRYLERTNESGEKIKFRDYAYPPQSLASDYKITIDMNENIYISSLSKVFKFTKNGDLISVLHLPIEDFKYAGIGFLANDIQNNLYVLLIGGGGDYFYSLYKFDNTGELVNNFKLDEKPGGRIIDMYITKDDFLLINTFPPAPNPDPMGEGNIFVYLTSGKYLGRRDYFFENSDGVGYKYFNLSPFAETEYILFKNDDKFSIKHSQQLNKVGSIKIPNINNSYWRPIFIDDFEYIYFLNNYFKILRVFNSKNELVKEIQIPERLDKNFICYSLNLLNTVKINRDGKIFVSGIIGKSSDISEIENYFPHEMSFIILLLN